jgi:hypothetical protein
MKDLADLTNGDLLYSGALQVRIHNKNPDANGEVAVMVIRDEGEFYSTVHPDYLSDEPETNTRDPRAPFPPGQDRTR